MIEAGQEAGGKNKAAISTEASWEVGELIGETY